MNLAEATRQLPNPADYFRGVRSGISGVPGNVLLFGRDRPFGGGVAQHGRHVLIVCLEGSGEVIIDGMIHPFEPGQGLLILPYQGHDYGRFAAESLCWLFATFEIDEQPALEPLRGAPCALDERSMGLLGELLAGFLAARAGDADAADALGFRLGELLARLARRAAEADSTGAPPAPLSGRRAVVRQAVRLVHEGIAGPLSAGSLSERVALSASRLRAVFREELGTSLGEFISRARMNRACALLGRSELSVSEVAAACGFESIYSFSRAFRRRRGMSATEFRSGSRRAVLKSQMKQQQRESAADERR